MSQLTKTVNGLAIASVKTMSGLAIASVKTIGGVDNTASSSPVAYISDVDKQDVASGNDSFTSFAVSGTNPAIIVCAAAQAATISGVSVSAGLTSGTPYLIFRSGAIIVGSYVEFWAIPAPSGTGTITVSYTSSVNHQCCAVLVQHADQTTPCPMADGASYAANSIDNPQTVTPANLTANDLVIYMGSNILAGDAPNAGGSGTEIFYGDSTNVNASVGYHGGTASVSINWSSNTTSKITAAVRVKAA